MHLIVSRFHYNDMVFQFLHHHFLQYSTSFPSVPSISARFLTLWSRFRLTQKCVSRVYLPLLYFLSLPRGYVFVYPIIFTVLYINAQIFCQKITCCLDKIISFWDASYSDVFPHVIDIFFSWLNFHPSAFFMVANNALGCLSPVVLPLIIRIFWFFCHVTINSIVFFQFYRFFWCCFLVPVFW